MHIINECPRCKKDFMYHRLDSHLYRTTDKDALKKGHLTHEVICQECDEKERNKKKKIECPQCKGKGYIESDLIGPKLRGPCGLCDGSGKL